MSDEEMIDQLLGKAKQGDQVSLQQLLAMHASELSRFISQQLGESHRRLIDPDDILQQTFTGAFRDIGRFEPQSQGTFASWLKTIARHRLQDAVKTLKRVKRGGHLRQVRYAAPTQSRSVAQLVDLLSAGSHTPSRSAAGHEAVQAVQDAIRQLPDDYRRAVELRLLEGRSLEETGAALDRSPRAVQGIVDRAKKKLRASLARLSL